MPDSHHIPDDEIKSRLDALIILIVVMVALFFVYLVVKTISQIIKMCAKDSKKHDGLDSVVVKSKKSGKKKSKSGKKSKGSSSRSSKSSSRKKKSKGKVQPKRSSKASESSAKGSVASSNKSAKKKKAPPSSKTSGEAPKSGKKLADSGKVNKIVERLPERFQQPVVRPPVTSTPSDVKTEDQIRRIPPQFGEVTPPPDLRFANFEGSRLSDRSIQQMAVEIAKQLAASNQPSQLTTPQVQPQPVKPSYVPEPQQQPIKPEPPVIQQTPQPPVRQAPNSMPMWAQGVPADSVYIMEGVGQNGETPKAPVLAEAPNATNSLMVDNQNMVPVDPAVNKT